MSKGNLNDTVLNNLKSSVLKTIKLSITIPKLAEVIKILRKIPASTKNCTLRILEQANPYYLSELLSMFALHPTSFTLIVSKLTLLD